jgi:tetratricopeptide (TPR) repeat protein
VEDIEDAIDLLVRFSLAGRGGEESGQVGLRGVVFHSMVQSFGRVTGGDKSAVAMVQALMSVGNVALDTDHFQRACNLPIPPKANPRILLDASDTEGAVNGILLPLVSHYQQKGLYFKARNAISSVIIDGMPNELQGRYLDRQASSLGDCGQYAEALPLYERALRISEKALGPEHPEVATTLNNMAELLRTQGKYEEALPLYERRRPIREKKLGEEHPDVA